MSTSDKLSYLATTKNKLKTTINYTGANITNDTFRNYPKKLYDSYLDILNNGISNLISNIPKVQGTGTYLDLTNTAEAPLIDFSLYGETQQDSTTGKNLLNVSGNTTTNLGITWTGYADGLLKLNGTASSTATYGFHINNTFNVGNYIFSLQSNPPKPIKIVFHKLSGGFIYGTITINSKSTNVSLTETCDYAQIYIDINITIGENINISLYPMLRLSSITDDSFEPYTNGASPNPDYPQPIHNVSGDNTIEICGKNLYNSSTDDIGKVYSATGAYNTSSSWNTSNWIKVESSTKYTRNSKTTGTTNFLISEFGKDKTFIKRTNNTSLTNTFTTDSTTKYIRISYRNDIGIYEIQLEKGTTSSEYEAYQGNSQLISLGVENLFDGELELGSYWGTDGTKISANDNYRNANIIKVQPNTTYTLSINGVSQKYVLFTYKEDKTFIQEITSYTTGTFTTGNNVGYINFRCFAADFTSDFANLKVQLEKGSKANSYSPYGASYIELNKISTYQDYIYKDNDKWYLHKEIGKVILSNLNWTHATSSSREIFYSSDLKNTMKMPSSAQDTVPMYATNYIPTNQTATWGNGDVCVRYSAGSIGGVGDLIVVNNNYNNTIDFINGSSNSLLYYPLATPTDTEITDTTLLEQLNRLMSNFKSYNNITHITQDNNDLAGFLNIKAVKEYE